MSNSKCHVIPDASILPSPLPSLTVDGGTARGKRRKEDDEMEPSFSRQFEQREFTPWMDGWTDGWKEERKRREREGGGLLFAPNEKWMGKFCV